MLNKFTHTKFQRCQVKIREMWFQQDGITAHRVRLDI